MTKTPHSDSPVIGDRYIYDGVDCWVIDHNEEGAWFGIEPNIPRIHRHRGAFRRFDVVDYPKKA
jgi:hypothetical protein